MSAIVQSIKCPLCVWSYVVPELPEHLNNSTLASIFGPGIMLQTAINRRTEQTERAIADHLKTHTTVEFVMEITRQTKLRSALLDGCNALVGLIQLVSSRDDIPPEVRDILRTNHRVIEAQRAIEMGGQS
jgi:hypothetical protein